MTLAALLIAASFLSGLAWDAGALHVRPEQAVAPLVALLALARPMRGRVPRAALLALVFLAAGLFGAFGEPDPARAAVHAARLLATILPVVLLPLLLDREEAERAWDVFLLCAVLASLAALAASVSHALLGTRWGMTLEPQLGYVHPQGTLLEPNILGALAAAAAAAFVLRAADAREPAAPRRTAALALLATAAAAGVSMTRAAWLALPLVAALLLVLARRRGSRARLALGLASGAVAAGALGAAILLARGDALGQARSGLAGKIASLGRLAEDPNVRVRLRSYEAALALFRERPLLGAGHGAMERLPGTEDARLAWAGNLETHLMADTGLVGLSAVLLLCATAIGHSLRRGTAGERRALERAGALLVVLVCAQATETSWLASFWVLLGLALASDAPSEEPRPLKILFVHPSDELYGSDRVLLELVSRLPKERVSPLVLLSSDVAYAGRLSARLRELGVPVVRFRLGVLRRRALASPLAFARLAFDASSAVLRIAAIVVRERVDVVHANTVAVLPAALAARLAGRPLVWHIHEIVPARRGRELLLGAVHLLASRVVTVSESARAALGRAGARAEVVPNGVDPAVLHVGSAAPPASPPHGGPVVLFLGRLAHRKGPDVLLEAFALLGERHESARLVFAGDEFAGGAETRRALERRAEELRVAARVSFVPFLDDIGELLASATVLASPSRLPESFGLSILEAMAAGRPVVATALGGPAELIEDRVSGLLVPPDDPRALAAALESILADPARARAMGSAARTRAARYPASRGAVRFVSIYEDLARSGNGAVAPALCDQA